MVDGVTTCQRRFLRDLGGTFCSHEPNLLFPDQRCCIDIGLGAIVSSFGLEGWKSVQRCDRTPCWMFCRGGVCG